MSNKSGTASQVISLPKGGGALKGMGEKFSPDLYTGTGNLTVPLALPAGRNGLQPEQNLVYSTGNGNGPFGLGWSLSVPGISRKTSKGVPRYGDGDVFVLSGAEDLVDVGRSVTESPAEIHHQIRYRPRTEGLFARITHHRIVNREQDTVAADYWRVETKDGLVSIYGAAPRPAGHIVPDGYTVPALADPHRPDHIFAWKLSETKDPLGNRIVYEYERDSSPVEDGRGSQLYLKRIRYIDYDDGAGQEQFLVSVRFHYEDRPDPFSAYRAGFEIRTRRRCTRIEISTHAGETVLARSYRFVYLDERQDLADLKDRLPPNKVSLLSQVQVTGHDGAATQALPPLEFAYTRFDPHRRDLFPLEGHLPARSLSAPDLEMADLFGNGLPDLVEINGHVRYWRNLGGGKFDLPRQMRDAPSGLSLADKGVQLVDAGGDGRIDLLVTTESNNGLSGYYPLRFGGLWDRRSFQRHRQAPSFNLEDPEVRLVDLDGDGITDAIRSGTRLDCFFSDPHQGWHDTRRVERRALDQFPNVNFSDPRVRWGDLSGDGLQDLVLVHGGSVEYWPSLGHGDWAPRVQMRNSPRLPRDYAPQRVLIGDIDGDGLDDLVYVDDGRLMVWINQSGNGWSEPIVIRGTPPVTDMDAVRLVDLLGNGVGGVLWTRDGGPGHRHSYHFHDFTGGLKPYLLSEMDNRMGAVTRVGYASSTRFYLRDQARPETRWRTPLPFPVQVVARVEVVDQISKGKLTTEYGYHHGYWDGGEREFRGFGRVDQRDTEVFERYHAPGLHPDSDFQPVDEKRFSPPLETRTWFHQGPVSDEFGDWEETDFSGEFWPGDPQLLERPSTMVQFLKNLPRQARRDALRTLRGSTLRTELYALDGTPRQGRPYTVTEGLFGVREEDPPADKEDGRERIFYPHALAQRTTQWERGDDPMTSFEFSQAYDRYGQVTKEIEIACPRGWRNLKDRPGEPYLAALTETTYAQPVDSAIYIVDRVARGTVYEIENDGSQRLLDLRDKPGTAGTLSIISQSLSFYDGAAFTGRTSGQVGRFGALVRQEALVLTPELLAEAYKNEDGTEWMPPYLDPGGATSWTGEYPLEFRKQLPARRSTDPTRPDLTIVPAGYGYAKETAGSPYVPGYYTATERRQYDVQMVPSGQGRGLVRATRDPLGNETDITYDRIDLLPARVADPAGLVTRAEHDYRTMQPKEVTDPNGNRTAHAYTPLGLLKNTAKMGRSGEQAGDTLDSPGAWFTYDLLAFSQRGEPVSTSAYQREHHVTDDRFPLPERDNVLQTVDYHDGFGRTVQTRMPAEDLTFGQPPFGGEVLPAGQDDRPGSLAAVVGQFRAGGADSNVVVKGWRVYDNKSRMVERYEPFFATGWDYSPPTGAQKGQRVLQFYDPRGEPIRTINGDGAEERTLLGRPQDVANPDRFEPTPWETFVYDENDNAGRTHPAVSHGFRQHWNTPVSGLLDALGQTVASTEHSGPDPSLDRFTTRSRYDMRGNLLEVQDVLGRRSIAYAYDLTQSEENADGDEESSPALRTVQLDGGVQRVVFDAAGNQIEHRDSKGSLILQAYDALQRPVRLWARDSGGEAATLREHLTYGDSREAGLAANDARAANLLGRLYQHCDEAGRLTLERYDFRGNVVTRVRHVINLQSIRRIFDAAPANWQVTAFRVDWQPPRGENLASHAAALLDPSGYPIAMEYDALERIRKVQYPEAVEGKRPVVELGYNRAGALKRVEVNGTPYVRQIARNAKGQRTLVAYGNGVMTRYAHDARTFRLVRMRSERYRMPRQHEIQAQGNPLQDIAYEYDLQGNLLSMTDRTPGCGVKDNPQAAEIVDPGLAALVASGDALVRRFAYDPLNRLTRATGRICKTATRAQPWDDDPTSGFGSGRHGTPNQDNAPYLTAPYQRDYAYDPMGNLVSIRHHSAGNSGTERFGVGGLTPDQWQAAWSSHLDGTGWSNPPNNHLTHTGSGAASTVQTLHYDANGNTVREGTARHFEWDHSDRMRVFRTQSPGAEPSVHAHYLYDSAGQRVIKVVRQQGGHLETTVYIDEVFEHHRVDGAGSSLENNRLHIVEGEARLAVLRVGAALPGDGSPQVQYVLEDHLGSSSVVVDDGASWVNREEYMPYGETSFGGYARKRFRFGGNERDQESGLGYWQARYYAPYYGRFLSVDPVRDTNPYWYARVSPVCLVDPLGRQPEKSGGSGDPKEQPDPLSGGEPLGYSEPVLPGGVPMIPGPGKPVGSGEPAPPPPANMPWLLFGFVGLTILTAGAFSGVMAGSMSMAAKSAAGMGLATVKTVASTTSAATTVLSTSTRAVLARPIVYGAAMSWEKIAAAIEVGGGTLMVVAALLTGQPIDKIPLVGGQKQHSDAKEKAKEKPDKNKRKRKKKRKKQKKRSRKKSRQRTQKPREMTVRGATNKPPPRSTSAMMGLARRGAWLGRFVLKLGGRGRR